jgi:secretion/DNA translocation related TadE-like protein
VTVKEEEVGSATVWVVALTGLLALIAGGLAAGVSLVVTHRQAQNAADLAALAGAAAQQSGESGCGRAAEAAQRNGAELAGCTVEGSGVVRVTVSKAAPAVLSRLPPLIGTARAGPAG